MQITASTFQNSGVVSAAGDGVIRLRGSILSGGVCGSAAYFFDAGHNVQSPGSTCPARIPVADPQLAPAEPADNGGPTRTFASHPAARPSMRFPSRSAASRMGRGS